MIEYLEMQTAAFAVGVVLDFIIGDPHFRYHPICLVGNLIAMLEKKLRKLFPKTEKGEFTAGIFLAVSVCVVVFAVAAGISFITYKINKFAFLAAESIMCCFIISAKALRTESMSVYKRIADDDIEGARKAVSMIVGRDTAVLNKEGIIKAAVETVAENTSDGVIAPMLFILLGGAPFGFLYKAINTMDSMVGYKNDNYLYFGRAAAKLDDFANFIPSRISAYLIIAASALCGYSTEGAYRIYKRDRHNHASPNSAQTEAACAGALGVRLAGDAYYFGRLYRKKYIGDSSREIENEDIKKANKLLYTSAVLMVIIYLAVRCCMIGVII